jgi:hypothetical protein
MLTIPLPMRRPVDSPSKAIPDLLLSLEVSGYDLDRLRGLVDKQSQSKWQKYADESWFNYHEMVCKNVLEEFLQQ